MSRITAPLYTALGAALLVTLTAAAPVTTTPQSGAQARDRTPDARANRRICVVFETTGTRMGQRVCKTRAQWEREGGVPSED